MKTFEVSLCRIEHLVYRTKVEAKSEKDAREKAYALFDNEENPEPIDWYNDDNIKCVHAEEFVQDVS